jgi:diguanylate cyclase (GGDEF)-like protein
MGRLRMLSAGRLAAERDAARIEVAQLRRLAFTDALTGLANRRGLQAASAGLFTGAGRAGGLLVDLDGFKPVNDRFGHAAGDAVLVAAAGRLTAAVAGGGCVARLGGDEFVVLLGGLPADPAAAGSAALGQARRVVGVLLAPYRLAGGELVTVGASVGAATATGGSLAGLLAAADLAMYAVKRAGGAGVGLAPDPGQPAAGVAVVPAPRRPAEGRPVGRLRDGRSTRAGVR